MTKGKIMGFHHLSLITPHSFTHLHSTQQHGIVSCESRHKNEVGSSPDWEIYERGISKLGIEIDNLVEI
jgi:hypothetical protein